MQRAGGLSFTSSPTLWPFLLHRRMVFPETQRPTASPKGMLNFALAPFAQPHLPFARPLASCTSTHLDPSRPRRTPRSRCIASSDTLFRFLVFHFSRSRSLFFSFSLAKRLLALATPSFLSFVRSVLPSVSLLRPLSLCLSLPAPLALHSFFFCALSIPLRPRFLIPTPLACDPLQLSQTLSSGTPTPQSLAKPSPCTAPFFAFCSLDLARFCTS